MNVAVLYDVVIAPRTHENDETSRGIRVYACGIKFMAHAFGRTLKQIFFRKFFAL